MSKVPTFSRRQAEEVRADVRPLIGRSGNSHRQEGHAQVGVNSGAVRTSVPPLVSATTHAGR